MATRSFGGALRDFLRSRHQSADALGDGELLQRFHRDCDEAAFAVLVDRHAALVLGVCHRVLGHEQDAEDAFQATFLILARKATALDRQRSVASWLFTVAHNLALKARISTVRRQAHERKAAQPMHVDPGEATAPELSQFLDAEIRRLPEKYRAALMLCYLEGKTNEQAAQELGWPSGSMARRLARARDLLRDRLVGRGLAPAAATAVGLGLTESAPAALREATVRAALVFAFPTAAATGALSVRVTTLAEAGLHAMKVARLRVAALLVLVLGSLGSGTVLLAAAVLGNRPGQEARENEREPALAANEASAPQRKAAVDRRGDLLPDGAVNRLGTLAPWRRAPGRSVVFSPDGAVMATISDALYLVDVATGKELGRFSMFDRPDADRLNVDSMVVFSPNGAVVAATSTLDAVATIRLWSIASGQELRCLTGLRKPVTSLTFSADGRTLTVLATNVYEDFRIWDADLRIWDVATGKELLSREHVHAPAFSADGHRLAASEHVVIEHGKQWYERRSEHQDHVKIWDTATGKEQLSLTGVGSALAFSPDGKTLAVGGDDGSIRFLDPVTGRETGKLLEEHPGDKAVNGLDKMATPHPGWKNPFLPRIRSLLFSHDGATLASCSTRLFSSRTKVVRFGERPALEETKEYRESLILWDVAKKQARRELADAADNDCLVFSRDGGTLVSATGRNVFSTHQNIKLWDVRTGRERATLPADSDRGMCFVGFSRDERTLVTSTVRGIQVWSTATGQTCASLAGSRETATKGVCLSPVDGRLAVVNNACHQIVLWDMARGQVSRLYGARLDVRSVAYAPDNKRVAAATASGVIHVWDARTGQEIGQTALLAHHEENDPVAMAVAFSPDGKMLAAAGANDRIAAWASGDLKEIWKVKLKDKARGRLRGDDLHGELSCLAFSPDGQTLAVGGSRGVCLLETATGTSTRALKCPGDIVMTLGFSPDGKQLVAGTGMASSYPHTQFMCLWDVGTGKEVHRFPGHAGAVPALAFSPNGREVASVTFAGKLCLWEAATGNALHNCQAHPGPPRDDGGGFPGAALVHAIAYSPDGKTLALAGRNKYLALWEVATMRQRCRLDGHTGDVTAVAFSADGGTLVTGSEDATVLIWSTLKSAADSTAAARPPEDWDVLADVDAAKAFEVMQSLVADRRRAVSFLKDRLRPAVPDDPALDRWVADLESSDFAVRQKAAQELENAGDRAAPTLRKTLAKAPNLETPQRLERLLQKQDAYPASAGEALRAVRAIEVLEHLGTPEGAALLESLAKGSSEARRTQEAKAALQRLQSRGRE